MKTSTRPLLLAVSALVTLPLLTHCTRQEPEPSPSLLLNARPFDFDYESVRELVFSSFDPEKSGSWVARLRMTPGTVSSDRSWEVVAAPEGMEILDRKADANFILHLLDSFRSLQVTAEAPKGPLASFGLEPPRHAFQWRTQQEWFELHLGDAPKEGGRYARIVQAKLPSGQKAPDAVVVVRGATLGLLQHVSGFETLRRRVLLPIGSDDVDVIEIPGGLKFERQGTDWLDRRKKLSRLPVNPWLEAMTHLRIQSFLDDPKKSQELRKKIEARPRYQFTLLDRHGKPTHLKVAALRSEASGPEELWATVSTRPESVFRIFSEASKHFELLKARR